MHGYVKHTDSKGCFVYLTRDIVARVLIKDVSTQAAHKLYAVGCGVECVWQMRRFFRPSEHGFALLIAFKCNNHNS